MLKTKLCSAAIVVLAGMLCSLLAWAEPPVVLDHQEPAPLSGFANEIVPNFAPGEDGESVWSVTMPSLAGQDGADPDNIGEAPLPASWQRIGGGAWTRQWSRMPNRLFQINYIHRQASGQALITLRANLSNLDLYLWQRVNNRLVLVGRSLNLTSNENIRFNAVLGRSYLIGIYYRSGFTGTYPARVDIYRWAATAGCPTQPISWGGDNCRGQAVAGSIGTVRELRHNAGGYTGTIRVQCNAQRRWVLQPGTRWTCTQTGGDLNPALVEASILRQTNTFRRNNQRTQLVRDARLDAIARGYALRIARDGWWRHHDIQTRFAQGRRIGYGPMGENEAKASYRSLTNDAWGSLFYNQWLNSPPHRGAMLDSRFTHIGIGFVRSGNMTAAVQFFGGR